MKLILLTLCFIYTSILHAQADLNGIWASKEVFTIDMQPIYFFFYNSDTLEILHTKFKWSYFNSNQNFQGNVLIENKKLVFTKDSLPLNQLEEMKSLKISENQVFKHKYFTRDNDLYILFLDKLHEYVYVKYVKLLPQ